ncbi:hypothetical protein A3F07_04530 [candidate division WWE3 bacterium RIFCSPHIGHO2_12_FULL_38_15]|uniref:Adenylate kinase n=1 Tax=candidate division WWE3 bacterium RIFCSPHIGHO2_02_FULL_38_14 TaxID=1802620 RepID=A0A1F4VDB0_UNCKA|nr:MAG: hypothetical protein A2793_03990 [candidate division WWE3 bacterium RIFCSPHIGHO2_01_FULL_38_45]OGC49016.1 MAG: hypothetical protein A3F07_04530 [candidate division WWE3 bacterium RIFCSPHIGHO2_12_FULL_38_15]OGC54627.1 MAG: hypothetical protein A3B64_03145 [candidate division WWE3 bacterium RIFCSPLOWO2_01_FULL_37_24]OGC54663.1 MAG: hypothetical protein A3D91_03580 [candidate division WWE3 bacterium RIFCSPHIGHO2_02_FULL_38_14]HLB51369.1 hypothetical protein [Patescibacteria group bacterium
MGFPIFNSKELSNGKVYSLSNPGGRYEYFHAKLGSKIDEVKSFLENNTFVGFMLAKKMAGKGTYAKMLEEILGRERFAHISVGDIVREVHEILVDSSRSAEKKNMRHYLEKYYRGLMTIEEAFEAIENRSQGKISIPTELILPLLKREIEKIGRKALFIDGLPRNLDQVSYSLYFRDLINYRDDPDFFVLVDTPLEVIENRMKHRLVCPVCNTSKSLTYNPTKFVNYDAGQNKFYLLCDNVNCSGYNNARYVEKEGDASGVASIKERLDLDEKLMKMAITIYGIPKVLVRSAVPVEIAHDYLEDYEFQQEYSYKYEDGEIKVSKKPWEFKDDSGVVSNTMLAATYVLNMFSQIHKILIG